MKFFGNDMLLPGQMDDYKPIEHGITMSSGWATNPKNAKAVINLKTGKQYPTLKAAALASGIHRITIRKYILEGKGWALIT